MNILLVDDHTAIREGTKAILEKVNNINITTVATSMETLEIVRQRDFDLFIFDLFLPTISGLELTKRVISIKPDAIIIIMSGFDLEPHINSLIESGASGFVSKTATKEQLITTIHCALRQETVIPTHWLRQLRRNDASVILRDGSELKDISITEKEQDILIEASVGKTNKEIAQELLMSQRMVEYHLTRIFGKLNVRSKGEAVAKARELKLIPFQKLT